MSEQFGSNQKIALAALMLPFVVATAFVLLGKGDAAWWGGFVGTLVPIVTGIALGGSAIIKGAQALKGKPE